MKKGNEQCEIEAVQKPATCTCLQSIKITKISRVKDLNKVMKLCVKMNSDDIIKTAKGVDEL